jgi:hypothetical protein
MSLRIASAIEREGHAEAGPAAVREASGSPEGSSCATPSRRPQALEEQDEDRKHDALHRHQHYPRSLTTTAAA